MTSEETGGHLCARCAEELRYGLQDLCVVLAEEQGATVKGGSAKGEPGRHLLQVLRGGRAGELEGSVKGHLCISFLSGSVLLEEGYFGHHCCGQGGSFIVAFVHVKWVASFVRHLALRQVQGPS